MKTLPFAGSGLNWQDYINFSRMRQERLAKTQAVMKRHGLAACILGQLDNVLYATGVRGPSFGPQLRLREALVFAEDDTILFEDGPSLEHSRRHCSWIKPENWRYSLSWWGGLIGPGASGDEAKKWAESLKRELKDKGLDKEKLGVDRLDEFGRYALKEAGIEVAEAMPAMVEARLTKTEDEINCFRMAAAIVDLGFYKLYETLRPGIRESEVIAVGMEALYRAGAEHVGHVAIRSGPNCFPVFHVVGTDRILQVGDMVIIDLPGISFMGYLTCVYRTFIVGRKPTDREKDWHKQCYEHVYAVIDAIKPGATTADAARKFAPASKWGYEAEEEIRGDQLGHGLGLANFEPPMIGRGWSLEHPMPFEKAMVIAIEAAEGEPFVGGSRIEEMIVVTDTGCEVLNRFPTEEILVCAAL